MDTGALIRGIADGRVKILYCTEASTRWRVVLSGEQFQLQNADDTTTCVEAYDGEFASAATCSDFSTIA